MTPTPEERAREIARLYAGGQTDYRPCIDLCGWFVSPTYSRLSLDVILLQVREKIAVTIRAAEDSARAEEREACAKIAEADCGPDSFLGSYSTRDIQRIASERIAAAIRDVPPPNERNVTR